MIKKNTKKYEKFNKDLFSYFEKIKKNINGIIN